MKDRTPKYPGRVKLEPVAGQQNIYDMTRADEPDDTGTPFNTRTMLQDSTGRFLKLPYANPLVDDALRHMPDRIEPIGTVKTSPALSLGDAWLPCDGSQVTFAEYPELYQMLRNISGSVQWSGSAFTTDGGAFAESSDPVYFNGKWYIAGAKLESYVTSVYNAKCTITIASAASLSGEWSVVYTTWYGIRSSKWSEYESGNFFVRVLAAASDNKVVFVLSCNDTYALFATFVSMDGTSWQASSGTSEPIFRSMATDGTTWALIIDDGDAYSSIAPEDVSSFIRSNGHLGATQLSFCGGTWFMSGQYGIYAATSASGEYTPVLSFGSGDRKVSNVVGFVGKYYVAVMDDFGASDNLYHTLYIFEFTGDGTFTKKALSTIAYKEKFYFRSIPKVTTGENILAILYGCGGINDRYAHAIVTTSAPNTGFDSVSLPDGLNPAGIAALGNMVVCANDSAVAYHDYSSDVRTLPTIALSDDTTTYIKAKKELDVFEAQESGGD